MNGARRSLSIPWHYDSVVLRLKELLQRKDNSMQIILDGVPAVLVAWCLILTDFRNNERAKQQSSCSLETSFHENRYYFFFLAN